jgi:polyhydroxybutyrate depolymerase
MFLRLGIVGVSLLWVCCIVSAAAEPPSTGSSEATTERRIDRTQLQTLRERLQERFRRDDASADSDLKRITWEIGGTKREALVYVPSGEHKTAHPPLIFAFHGHGGTSAHLVRKFALHELWPEAVCVYPQGLPTPAPKIDPEGKRSGWQKYIGDQEDRDLKFFDAILKTMQTDHAVDAKRIYSTGHSNGGFFTYVLWAARDDVFAALAPIAGGLNLRDLVGRKPKPVLHVAGENDKIVRYDLQRRTMEYVRKLNGCDATGKAAGEHCMEFTSADGPPVVEFVHPGGHEIPDGAPQRITEFFKQHSLK